MPRLDEIERKLLEVAESIAAVSAMVAAAPRPADAPTLDYVALTGNPAMPIDLPTAVKVGSRVCRQGDFSTDGFRYWTARMRQPLKMHRKLWEWFFIADALFQRGQLGHNRRGIGFGVGREPLTSLFASFGCSILATDMAESDPAAAQWSGQHAASLEALNGLALCDEATFRENVSFRAVDMNDVPRDLNAQFDFCWSSCSFEHLGSIEHGLRFVERSMETLKPGGIAVHTTEFNMSSNADTFESPDLSLYRKRDLESLAERLERAGHCVEPLDWDRGQGYADGYVDLPPFGNGPLHLRLRIAQYDCTSIGLIIRGA